MKPEDRSWYDQMICERHARGDMDGAATAAIRGYGREIMGFLAGRVRDEDAAKEIFLQFSEALWKGIEGFEGRNGASFRTWAYILARNAINRYFRNPDQRRDHTTLSKVAEVADEIRSMTSVIFERHRNEALYKITERLDDDERELLILRAVEEMPFSQIAAILDTTEAAAKMRFGRLKEKMRAMARQEGLAHD